MTVVQWSGFWDLMPSKTRYLLPDLFDLLAFRAAATVADAHADELDLQPPRVGRLSAEPT